VNSPSDVVKEGDVVKVKLLGFDDRGKVRLSMKAVNQETGEEIPGVTDDGGSGRRERGEGGDRPRGERGGRGRGGRERAREDAE
jgi:polyribonucleotide nucleotidyltransferase